MGRKLYATEENKKLVMSLDEKDQITDKVLLKKSLIVIFLVIAGFLSAEHIGLQNGTIAMLGAAVLIFLYGYGQESETKSKRAEKAFAKVDWVTIFFFAGLFVIVAGVEHTGLLEIIANKIIHATEGDLHLTAFAILWLSAIISAFLDNIPFVATMIPLLKNIESSMNGASHAEVLWWALALGACLGGNGSLIGASANVMVAGMAERHGKPIHFMGFLLYGVPVMIITIILSHIYIYFKYFS
ncbi:MAG: Citrate transporter [Alphaproteobacteria bacterium ADurb.Bin438]|nr:MAG: Citrate transporter [Alphaproteobacteria bacterium ADurb.Bin438]